MIGWLLDTNVVAEVARAGGDARVLAWMALQAEATMFISVLTLAEYDKGIANLPPQSEARARIASDIETLEIDYASRVLSVSDRIVRRWGMIAGAVQQQHRLAPPVVDTLLAATAVEHDLYLVTRNVKDVRFSGAAIFNPWLDDPADFRLLPRARTREGS